MGWFSGGVGGNTTKPVTAGNFLLWWDAEVNRLKCVFKVSFSPSQNQSQTWGTQARESKAFHDRGCRTNQTHPRQLQKLPGNTACVSLQQCFGHTSWDWFICSMACWVLRPPVVGMSHLGSLWGCLGSWESGRRNSWRTFKCLGIFLQLLQCLWWQLQVLWG